MIWRPIKNYEGSYEINALGQVRSLARLGGTNSPMGGRRVKGGMLKPFSGTSGSITLWVSLSKNGITKPHRLETLMHEHWPTVTGEYQKSLCSGICERLREECEEIYLSDSSVKEICKFIQRKLREND